MRSFVPERIRHWKDRIAWISQRHEQQTGQKLQLYNPVLFSEKMQWRKLFDAKPLYTTLSDKIAVRSYIADHGFEDLLIPLLWTGADPRTIPFDDLPRPFVLKSTHASGHVIVVDDDSTLTLEEIVPKAQDWLEICFGSKHTVFGYVGVPHRLMVEPLLRCADGTRAAEMKVFVFDGIARFVQYLVVSDDASRTRRVAYLSRDWERWDWHGRAKQVETVPEPPDCYRRILDVSEALCRRMDHCRVDFYVRDRDLFIGELTPYSWSGWHKLKPPEVDAVMGSFWTLRWPVPRAALAILLKRWGQT